MGAGNHYAEIQVVDEIYDEYAAKKMGIEFQGQVCTMIHCGSRGLGHQVATGKGKYLYLFKIYKKELSLYCMLALFNNFIICIHILPC